MNNSLRFAFTIVATVFCGLLLLEALGGFISKVFPLGLWFAFAVLLGVMSFMTLPTEASKERIRWWSVLSWVILYSLLLAGYFAITAWRYGPFNVLLIISALLFPILCWRLARQP